jgi:hypothetical protein
MKFKVEFREARKIREYESLTISIEREIDTATENMTPAQALNICKAFVFTEMTKALEEARKR